MVWTTLSAGQRDADSPGDTIVVDALYNNPTAIAAGDSGAPRIVQGALDASSGNVSRSHSSGGSSAGLQTLPGGEYGFFVRSQLAHSGNNDTGTADSKIAYASGGPTSFGLGCYVYTSLSVGSTFGGTTYTLYTYQRYVNASPPYDMGDGVVPLFVFALVDNTTREVEGVYAADCAPWHYNGPTDIRPNLIVGNRKFQRRPRRLRHLAEAADDPVLRAELIAELRSAPMETVEITQAIKQADMPLIPHPWHTGNDLTGKTVVLLDPVSDLVARLAELHNAGENINEILHADYLRPDNTALTRAGPPGVRVVAPRWRNTG